MIGETPADDFRPGVLHLIHRFVAGGAESLTAALAEGASAAGWRCRVCAWRRGGPVGDRLMRAGIPATVLGLPQVGAEDNFFALDGHSLLATQLVERLGNRLGLELGLGELLAIAHPRAWATRIQAVRNQNRETMEL